MSRRDCDDGSNVLVRFESIGARSSKAVKICVDVDEDVWLPESQIAHLDEDAGEVWIPLWLAEKKGLEYQ
jgi:hypothetical protein